MSMRQLRSPYLRDGHVRPAMRGVLMARLIVAWPLAVAVHSVVCACFQPPVERAAARLVALRLLCGSATTASVLVSDRYHNGDQHGHNLATEIFWLRLDFVGISAVLTTTFVLWAAHTGFTRPFGFLCVMAAALTAAIAALAHLVYETDCDGYTSYKVPFGVDHLALTCALLITYCLPSTY